MAEMKRPDPDPDRSGPKRSLFCVLRVFGAAAGAYLLCGVIAFDFSAPALPVDEDTRGGRAVAWGPRPRFRNGDESCRFDGSHWEFWVFSPVCWTWRHVMNYSEPSP